MLDGIIVRPLKRFIDERGSNIEVISNNWKNLLKNDKIVETNLTISYPYIIRAWHKHPNTQTDYFTALEGAIKICAYDPTTAEITEIISTQNNLQTVRIPGQYWHGYRVISYQAAKVLHFSTKIYDSKKPNKQKKPWNDATIIPKTINGKTNDPRVGIPYNWHYPPHK